jgi:hypothetical protein
MLQCGAADPALQATSGSHFHGTGPAPCLNMFGVIVAYPTEEREKKQDGFAKPLKSDVR